MGRRPVYVLFRPVSRALALVMAFAKLAMATVLGLNSADSAGTPRL